MEKIWIIGTAILIFLIITFLYWKSTKVYAKKEYGKNMWKQWGTRTFYWQGAILVSSGITVIIIFLLKWGKCFDFLKI